MANYIGLALDATTHDLALDDRGNLKLARDAEAVGQHVKQRLKFFVGEFFLDITAGLPWLPKPGRFAIFDRPYDAGTSEALIKAEILDTPGLRELTSFEARVDRITRGLKIEAEAVPDIDVPGETIVISAPVEASFFVHYSTDFS
jgi:hypothetical protein